MLIGCTASSLDRVIMYGYDDMKAAINDGHIVIKYADLSSESNNESGEEQSVNFAIEDSFANKCFRKNYFGDRLSLCLGPLVYSHTYSRKLGRKLFRSTPHCFDLRKTNGTIVLEPKETIIVETIENIHVDHTIAAFILPRLSLANSGIMVSPAYIDPNWSGILQLHIENQSNRKYELKIGEKIAICRFYQIENDKNRDDVTKFAAKSFHYGLSWEAIFSGEKSPFPLRKMEVKSSPVQATIKAGISYVIKHWQGIFGMAMIPLIIAIISWINSIENELSSIPTLTTEVNYVSESISDIQASLPKVGKTQINFPIGVATKTIRLETDLSREAPVFVTAYNLQDRIRLIKTTISQTSSINNWELEITVSRNDPLNQSETVEIGYVIFPED